MEDYSGGTLGNYGGNSYESGLTGPIDFGAGTNNNWGPVNAGPTINLTTVGLGIAAGVATFFSGGAAAVLSIGAAGSGGLGWVYDQYWNAGGDGP